MGWSRGLVGSHFPPERNVGLADSGGWLPILEDWNVQSSLSSRADSTQISTAVPPFGHRYIDL